MTALTPRLSSRALFPAWTPAVKFSQHDRVSLLNIVSSLTAFATSRSDAPGDAATSRARSTTSSVVAPSYRLPLFSRHRGFPARLGLAPPLTLIPMLAYFSRSISAIVDTIEDHEQPRNWHHDAGGHNTQNSRTAEKHQLGNVAQQFHAITPASSSSASDGSNGSGTGMNLQRQRRT